MMSDPHFGYILAAYGICFVVVAALIIWISVDYRVQRGLLSELEARGVKRRARKSGGQAA